MGNYSRLDKTYRIKSVSRYGKQRQTLRHSGMVAFRVFVEPLSVCQHPVQSGKESLVDLGMNLIPRSWHLGGWCFKAQYAAHFTFNLYPATSQEN